MDEQGEGRYATEQRVTLAEAPGLRVRLLELAADQSVPWHHHTAITDTFFCMQGPMRVRTRDPDETHVLQPGGTFAVAPGVVHRVDGPCRFIAIQGVGTYDYVALEE